MATEERDHTDDWVVPAERRPPSAFELQRQIEVAAGIARAAEEAALEIGQAALEAAEQARRAAVHAERSAAASVAAARGGSRPDHAPGGPDEPTPGRRGPAPDQEPAPDPAPGHELIPGSELPVAWSPVDGPPAAAPASAPSSPPAAPADPRLEDFIRRADQVDRRLRIVLDGEARTSAAAGRVRATGAGSTVP